MLTVALLIAAGVLAVIDWVAVQGGLRRVELVAKPLTLGLLTAAAAVAGLGELKAWVVAALALGVLGDAALLRDGERAFLAGLSAFLVGHVAWLVAFALAGLHPLDLLAGALVAAGAAGLVMPAVVRGAHRAGGRPLAGAVVAYGLVLAALTTLAAGTAILLVAAGGVLFLASDALLARDRFARPVPHGRLAVIVTYHAAQFLLLIGLVRSG